MGGAEVPSYSTNSTGNINWTYARQLANEMTARPQGWDYLHENKKPDKSKRNISTDETATMYPSSTNTLMTLPTKYGVSMKTMLQPGELSPYDLKIVKNKIDKGAATRAASRAATAKALAQQGPVTQYSKKQTPHLAALPQKQRPKQPKKQPTDTGYIKH